jgi:hypothetical protein
MKRAFLIAALLALVAGSSAPAKPFHLVLGIIDQGGARLVYLDAETLGVTDGPSVALGKWGGSWAISQDRSQFVYADQSRLRFFDAFRFTPEADVRLSGGGPVVWLDALTVAIVRRTGANAVEVVKVDWLSRVHSRKRLAGVVLAARTLPNTLVVLLGRENKIAPVRLLVVEPQRTRVVQLGGIWGGTVVQRRNPPVVAMRRPALALDEAKATAYVADPAGTVVELPLSTLAATSRTPRGGFAKFVYGSERQALLLGDGLLAITGSERSQSGMRPAGLELVDTRAWSSRLVEPRASAAWSSTDWLLVTGTSWDAKTEKGTAMGLVVLDPTGQTRFRLFEGLGVWVNALVGSRAYVGVQGEREAVVVDLVTGQVTGHRTRPLPLPLLGRSSSD